MFFNSLAAYLSDFRINIVLKRDLVSVVTAHMVYFKRPRYALKPSKISRYLGVGRAKSGPGVNGLILFFRLGPVYNVDYNGTFSMGPRAH